MTCPRCLSLEVQLRTLAASNLALCKEIDFLRAKVLELGLTELSNAPAIDLSLKRALTEGDR